MMRTPICIGINKKKKKKAKWTVNATSVIYMLTLSLVDKAVVSITNKQLSYVNQILEWESTLDTKIMLA
uniref:Uncharacterized protein n=1 Tax=Rhizophora mucronata TaxID=61149 RepID=A0A2P2N8D9_RHIMU